MDYEKIKAALLNSSAKNPPSKAVMAALNNLEPEAILALARLMVLKARTLAEARKIAVRESYMEANLASHEPSRQEAAQLMVRLGARPAD